MTTPQMDWADGGGAMTEPRPAPLVINITAKPGTTPEMIVQAMKASKYWRELTTGRAVQAARRAASLRKARDRHARVKARRRAKGWPT